MSVEQIPSKLLNWFRPELRPMPWREHPSPYGTWISEIMLQQTQVPTVIPYWLKWIAKWPDVQALATATEEEVILYWEGLGYYSRARNILKASKIIAAEHDGIIPSERKDLLNLPGIGEYTAGAIASIAYNKPAAILDGNVIRLLCRLFCIEGSPSDQSVKKHLWSLSHDLVKLAEREQHPHACSWFNQAMMDLGAGICSPQNPTCLLCPLQSECQAFKDGKQSNYPQPKQRLAIVERCDTALFILNQSEQLLLQQRDRKLRNHGFWQFPMIEDATPEEAKIPFEKQGFIRKSVKPIGIVKHSITHYKITVSLFLGECVTSSLPDSYRWVNKNEIKKLPVTSSHRKLFEKIKF